MSQPEVSDAISRFRFAVSPLFSLCLVTASQSGLKKVVSWSMLQAYHQPL